MTTPSARDAVTVVLRLDEQSAIGLNRILTRLIDESDRRGDGSYSGPTMELERSVRRSITAALDAPAADAGTGEIDLEIEELFVASQEVGILIGKAGRLPIDMQTANALKRQADACVALRARLTPTISAETIEVGANALWERRGGRTDMWDALAKNYRDMSRTVLAAAMSRAAGSQDGGEG